MLCYNLIITWTAIIKHYRTSSNLARHYFSKLKLGEMSLFFLYLCDSCNHVLCYVQYSQDTFSGHSLLCVFWLWIKKNRLSNFKYNHKNTKITVLPASSHLPLHCTINFNTNKSRHLFVALILYYTFLIKKALSHSLTKIIWSPHLTLRSILVTNHRWY